MCPGGYSRNCGKSHRPTLHIYAVTRARLVSHAGSACAVKISCDVTRQVRASRFGWPCVEASGLAKTGRNINAPSNGAHARRHLKRAAAKLVPVYNLLSATYGRAPCPDFRGLEADQGDRASDWRIAIDAAGRAAWHWGIVGTVHGGRGPAVLCGLGDQPSNLRSYRRLPYASDGCRWRRVFIS